MQVDLGSLGFAEGGYLLVKRAVRGLAPGDSIRVSGQAEDLDVHLRAWCRAEGHRFDWQATPNAVRGQAVIHTGAAETERWAGARHVSGGDGEEDSVAEHPPRSWGLAARGSIIEAGTPEFDFTLTDKVDVWSDDAARIYQQAVAAQWDPETAVPWHASFELSDDLEDAIVQVMTYLIENETAALIVPSRFIAQLHPHFREVMQVLAVQAADEARHIEVFTRRARLKRGTLGRSTIGGQTSLKTLVEEPQFADRVVPAVGARRGHVSLAAAGSSSAMRRIRSRRRWPGWRPRTKPDTSRSASRISASTSRVSLNSGRVSPMPSIVVTTHCVTPLVSTTRCSMRCC